MPDHDSPLTLEEAATQVLDVVDEITDDLGELGPPAAELRGALATRRELLGDADVDKCIRAGRALHGFMNIARRLGANVGQAEELETMDAATMRDELAADLTYAINAAGSFEECSVLERAKAIRDLTEAYVRLGGEVSIPLPPPLEAKVGRIDLTGIAGDAAAAAWQAASQAAASPDSIAQAVRASILEEEAEPNAH